MLRVHAILSGHETVGDHTEFIIQISCHAGSWVLSRRYSDFDHLHARLHKRFGDIIEARLPEKQWFGRFDREFLKKRQERLSEYIESVLQVPGILEDPYLSRFIELEKHVDTNGEMIMLASNDTRGNGAGNTRSGASRSGAYTEQDRLNAIVDQAAHAFIDISEIPEPLEAEQAHQRKKEIVSIAQATWNVHKVVEHFVAKVPHVSPCLPPVRSDVDAAMLLAYLEEKTSVQDGMEDASSVKTLSYQQQRELIKNAQCIVEDAVQFTITAPELDIVATIDTLSLIDSLENGGSAARLTSSSLGNSRVSNPSEDLAE